MARPAPVKNPRDRFRIIDEEAQENLSRPERDEDDRADAQPISDMEGRVEPNFDWPNRMDDGPVDGPSEREAVDEADVALHPAEAIAAQPETSPTPVKQASSIGIVPLILMALVAGMLSAAAVLFLF